MGGWAGITLGEIGRWISRFGPYLALVAVVTMVVGLAPGQPGSTGSGDVLASGQPDGSAHIGSDGAAAASDGAPAGDGGSGTGAPDAGPGTAGGPAVAAGARSGTGPAPVVAPGGGTNSAHSRAAAAAKNCDPHTKRVRMPSLLAPLCVPGHDGDNGGSTYRGVTKDSIKVAVYLIQSDATSRAIARAGGSDDTPEERKQQYREWVELYASQVETYGRAIELEFIEASGPATDDAAARADALRVVKSGAFASLNAPNTTYIAELAAKGVLCIQCGLSLPAEQFARFAPYAWTMSAASTWVNLHNVEFAHRYLWKKKAVHAGDPGFRSQDRVLGRISYDTADGSYKAAREFYERELKKRGVVLTAKAVYNGYPDTAKSQQQARPIIQQMKAAGVTTIILAADPFAPVFFTQEATRQQYFPEWVATGELLDTSFFARLYDQQQWRNMFAPTGVSARLPTELSESNRLLQWYYGRGPTAEGSYNLIRLPVSMLLTGIHYAGELLTPQTYAAGQFNLQPARGGKSFPAISYGTKVWPMPDYTGIDDVAFIWWDPSARGRDELGNDGLGLYRFVDGGQRRMPRDYPSSVRWFEPAGTVTVYDDYPAGERPPTYPRPKR